ncbi:MAG: Ig-like domain-containing protein, partial [Burkholderiales bacterium]|nr:Ig-like domain-containing protein [Burkholderiales bacterium]
GDIYVVAQLGDVVSNEVKIIGTLPALTALKITADKASAVLHEEVTFTPTATPELADISGIVYSIEEGSTGTGTIEGNVLTITGVGTINVIGTVGTIVSEAVSITAVLPSVTTITIAATKTEIEDTETVTFSETFTPNDGDTTGFEYVIDTANSTGTGTITDKVLTVTKAGTIQVYGHIGDLKSNVITITATHIEKCTTSVSTDVVNGTVTISPDAGSDIPTGEVTINATPDQSYLLTKVWVKIDGGEETEITSTGTNYTYTTEDRHSYVFGATFTEIEISTIASVKAVTDNTMVRIKGKCTYVKDAVSAYIQSGNDGVLVYYSAHGMEEGKTYDVYGSKDTYNNTIEIIKVTGSYINEITETIEVAETVINDNATATENFVLPNVGNKVKVSAKVTGLDNATETNLGNTTLDVDGVSIKLYRAKGISKDALNSLSVGDCVDIDTVIGNNKTTVQLLLLPTSTITKTNIAPTAITCVSDKETLALGATADLNETATLSTTSTGAWNSTLNKDAVTYEITDAGTTGATITGSTLSAISTGTIKVVSKYGDLTSAEISITVTDPLLSTLVISGASDATSVNKGKTLQLSVKDGRGNAVDGITWAVSEDSSTIASIDNTGLVTGLLTGSATITATKEGYTSAEFTLSVTDASLLDMVSDPTSVALTVGDADKELAISRDGAAVTGYTLTSTDEAVCTIVDNKIHAIAAGETDVTVSKDGYNSIIVHVVISDAAAIVEKSVIFSNTSEIMGASIITATNGVVDAETDGVKLKFGGVKTGSSSTSRYSYIMFNSNVGFVYNTESLGTIKNIVVTFTGSTSTSGKIGCEFGAEVIATKKSSPVSAVVQGGNITFTPDANSCYFQIYTTSKNVQIETIVINYSK